MVGNLRETLRTGRAHPGQIWRDGSKGCLPRGLATEAYNSGLLDIHRVPHKRRQSAASQKRSPAMESDIYLLCHVFKMLLDEIVASRMEQGKEAPGVSESDQMRFPREELDIQDLEQSYLFACNGRFVDSVPK